MGEYGGEMVPVWAQRFGNPRLPSHVATKPALRVNFLERLYQTRFRRGGEPSEAEKNWDGTQLDHDVTIGQ